ncbi:MAG: hypothetical protein HC798_01520 [Polaribacter sp.]|nr:hypothetical protein [Polaribacter sp.]
MMQYQLEIKDLQRTLTIVFENKAPYKIVGFTDTFPSAFDKKLRTTKAVLHKQILLDYWSKNSLSDSKLRKELGLD